MSAKKTGWSIIPRKCSCGCNRKYFSPMWKVCVGVCERIISDIPTLYEEYEYFSVKEFPDSKYLPKRDIRLSDRARLVSDYTMSDYDWDIIRRRITKSEFVTINYNIHIYPLSVNSSPIETQGLHYVALCVQEIPDIIAIGPDYTSASLKLRDKLEQWYDEHQPSQIPRPQEYDHDFVLSRVPKK